MQVNKKSITLGNSPKFFGVPIIVCVLPEPVWPYTNTHPLYPFFLIIFFYFKIPSKQLMAYFLPTISKISSYEAS
mgnify:CR=1 FL=1